MNHSEKHLSATELAQLGGCEQQMLLKKRWGDRTTAVEQQRMAKGQAVHEAYYQRLRKKPSDRRCFIATVIYGADAAETQKLRRFRDQHLLTSVLGRGLIKLYYGVAPYMSVIITRFPRIKRGLRRILDRLVKRL